MEVDQTLPALQERISSLRGRFDEPATDISRCHEHHRDPDGTQREGSSGAREKKAKALKGIRRMNLARQFDPRRAQATGV